MTHYDLVARNKRNSWIVVTLFMVLVTSMSWMMAMGFGYGLDLVGIALIVSGVMSFGSYYFSDKIVLAISGAREAKREEFFDFYTVTENLVSSQQLPQPKLYVINDTAMNAFATGRDPEHAVICATTGLLERLSRSEIEAVVGHELSHVKNYDIRLMSLVSVLVGMVALLADWLLRMQFWGGNRKNENEKSSLQAVFFVIALISALLAPLIAELIKLAISRQREFLADADSVSMTKNPRGMISALQKLSGDKEPLEAANKATAHLYIVNPLVNLHSGVGWFAGLFSTHPPMQERIAALEKI